MTIRNKISKSESLMFAVVIPAYNESENLQILVPQIFSVAPKAYIVIVDDSAEADHEKTLSAVFKYKDRVTVLARNGKLGRGSAVIHGMEYVLQFMPDVTDIVEMDADLAHSPSELPRFLQHSGNADLIIGSRYLKESRITDWPRYRLVQSKIINSFLNIWLGLRISDYTNGYRLYSKRAAEYLVNTPLRESGFIALSEVAFKLRQKGMKIIEIPISFTDRRFGKSNADVRELIASFIGAIRIRFSA